MYDDRTRPEAAFDPYPDPNLSAQDVVRLQLDALQNDDISRGEGMAIAFRFASPSNRRLIGTARDFSQVVYGSIFRPLVGFDRAGLGTPTTGRQGVVVQRVWIYRGKKIIAIYRFMLSRQSDEPYTDCWLVDAVIREA